MKRTMRIAVAAGIAALLAGCGVAGGNVTRPTRTPRPSPTATAPAGTYPASWVLPDHKLTPGVAGSDKSEACPRVDPALEAGRPGAAVKDAVYREYHIGAHAPGAYEIDHLDALSLAGTTDVKAANSEANLWPEPNDPPDRALIAKYHARPSYIHNSKDLLEWVLHDDVCSGKVPLADAQHAMITDWRAGYVKYVGPAPKP